MTAGGLEVTLFGSTRVIQQGALRNLSGVKPRQILEILAIANGSPVSKDRLADLVWEGNPPRTYPETLESYVCSLRRQIGSPGRTSVIVTTTRGYALDLLRASVDLGVCRSLLETARSSTCPNEVVSLTEQAAGLARQELLADEQRADWADQERRVFTRELVETLTYASASALRQGRSTLAVGLACRAVDLDSLAEEGCRQLMVALVSSERRGEALRVFADLRERLLDQLGVEPSTTTRELHRVILSDEQVDQSRCLLCHR